MAPHPHSLPQWHQTPPDSPLLQQWLLNEGSLTRLLRELSQDDFGVQPLVEGWQVLRDDECLTLNSAPGTCGWVREVFLCGQGQPWIYARSVASKIALESSGFDLASLGTRSLGELLFSDQAFQRGPFEICRLPNNILPAAAELSLLHHSTLWARRSLFSRETLGILVAEAFLPAFWAQLDSQESLLTAH